MILSHPTLRNAITSGSVASLLSAMMLAHRGRRDAASAAAPVNAVTHFLYGDRAYRADAPSLRHTALGYAVHHASAVLWALLYESILRRIAHSSNRGRKVPLSDRAPTAKPPRLTTGELVASAAVVTGIAALTDLRLVPPRLSPGFEHRLEPGSLVLVYAALAAGLVLGAALLRRD